MIADIRARLNHTSIIAFLAGVALLIIEYSSLGYPPYELTTVGLSCLLVYVAYAHSPGSFLFLSSLVLSYPLYVPFITTYLYQVSHYTILGVQFESRTIANKVVFLGFVMVLLSVYFVRSFYRRDRLNEIQNRLERYDQPIPYNQVGVASVIGITLIGAYLLAPGPTILSVGYEQQASYMPPWATFAGAVYKGAWAVLFGLLAANSLRSTRFQILVGTTLVCTIWLALHGRRVGSIGMVVLLFGTVLWHHLDFRVRDVFVNIRGLALGMTFGLYVGLLIAIGRLRKVLANANLLLSQGNKNGGSGVNAGGSGAASNNGGVDSVVSEAASSLQYGKDFVGLPGGGHGVYGTIQATIYLFDNEYEFLWGKTFVEYIPRAIPSGILAMIGISPPEAFRQILASSYNYNGGNYILNPYYANFGVIGVVLASLVLGAFLTFLYVSLRRSRPHSTLLTVVAAALFINLFRAYWYTQLNWVDTLQGVLLALVVYLGVHFIQNPNKAYTAMMKLTRRE